MPELEIDKLYKTAEELIVPEVAQINGRLPKWLRRGIYMRVGPAFFDLKNFTMKNWLDGYCMVSKFEIHGDTVSFQKQFLQSDAYKRALTAQKPVVCEFGTKASGKDLEKGLFSRLLSTIVPELSDNGQQQLLRIGNDIFSASETCYFRQLDIETLATGEKFDTNRLFGTNTASAHPLLDKCTGITYNIGVTCLTGLKYQVIKIPPASTNQSSKDQMKKSKILCSVPSSFPTGLMAYVHSFGLTSEFIVFIEQPLVMNISKAIFSVLKGQGFCFSDWLDWKPELNNKFVIVEKNTGKCIKMDIVSENPFFFLHFINCYQENGQIVIDLLAYKDPSVLEGMTLSKLRNGVPNEGSHQASAQRFVVPIFTGELTEIPENQNLVEVKSSALAVRRNNHLILTPEILTAPGLEFPAINAGYQGKKHTQFWATGSNAHGQFNNSLCKIDTKKNESIIWNDGPFSVPGEPIFVPNPKSEGEDDGIIISAVTDSRTDANDFLLYESRDYGGDSKGFVSISHSSSNPWYIHRENDIILILKL